jgi:hypothetical protein
MDIYHHYKEILKLRKDYGYERPSIQQQIKDDEQDEYIIERELVRQKLYNDILQSLKNYMNPFIKNQKGKDKWGTKEFNHLLLRYILNKIITKTDEDDPIFIYNKSEIVRKQLDKDNKYSGLNYDLDDLINFIDNELKKAYDILKNTELKKDSEVKIVDNKLEYKGIMYNDISKLGENNPKYIRYAVALNIRYTYIHLETHGLAREYDLMGFDRDSACEGFASAFNHYFNTFCSAFPDLERPYGSIGSFFSQTIDSWNKYIVFVNPPFDETLMNMVFDKVRGFLEEGDKRRLKNPEDTTDKLLESDHHYILTVPNWIDWEGFNKFKNDIHVYMTAIYIKGELPFINYMEDPDSRIYPSDIAELFCKKS